MTTTTTRRGGGGAAPTTSGVTIRHRAGKGTGEYLIFEKFAKKCESADSYWSCFFRSLVNGKFPEGVSIKDDFLIYRGRRKTAKMLKLPDPENWQSVADFFRQNCEIMSSKDWEGEKDKEQNIIVSLTTAQINMKKRKERISTIPAYVLELCKKYDLSSEEMLDVETLIRYHFNTRTFRDGDVIYTASGNIKDITALVFDPETRIFTVTREVRASREARENYIDTEDYLFGRASIKRLEKRLSFDDEMKKYLRGVYCINNQQQSTSGQSVNTGTGSTAAVVYKGVVDDEMIDDEDM